MALDKTLLEKYKMTGLPLLVAGPVDVGRLQRELSELDEKLTQRELKRQTGEVKLPKTTQLMDQTLELNKLNLLIHEDRKRLTDFLEDVKSKAPVLHISYSADPSTAFIEKIMAWLRREIHPLAMMTIGLQPNIAAGCIVRSTNKYFDLSLRKDFDKKRELLRDALTPAVAPTTDTVIAGTQPSQLTVAEEAVAAAAPQPAAAVQVAQPEPQGAHA
jgi:F0F1-type ATP synthase delta subunit